MSKKTDQDNLLQDKSEEPVDEGDFATIQPKARTEPAFSECSEDDNLKVPEKLNICQWIIIAVLYLIFAFLAGFIIYISATWNQDRTNEYT